jgi:hypothetical protein
MLYSKRNMNAFIFVLFVAVFGSYSLNLYSQNGIGEQEKIGKVEKILNSIGKWFKYIILYPSVSYSIVISSLQLPFIIQCLCVKFRAEALDAQMKLVKDHPEISIVQSLGANRLISNIL